MSAGKIATHSDPVRRDRTNYIIQVDLTVHGMPGNFEQLWTRTEDQRSFELCCLPFFTYGVALGDLVAWDENTNHLGPIVNQSGRRLIRVAFLDKPVAADCHAEVHGSLIQAGCLVEFSSEGYGSVDIAGGEQAIAVPELLARWVDDGTLIWEWGDQILK
jgi:hypothetical protein